MPSDPMPETPDTTTVEIVLERARDEDGVARVRGVALAQEERVRLSPEGVEAIRRALWEDNALAGLFMRGDAA